MRPALRGVRLRDRAGPSGSDLCPLPPSSSWRGWLPGELRACVYILSLASVPLPRVSRFLRPRARDHRAASPVVEPKASDSICRPLGEDGATNGPGVFFFLDKGIATAFNGLWAKDKMVRCL